MYDENMEDPSDLWPQHHAVLRYEDVDNAGPPLRPLDFPTPRVHRALWTTLHVRDHHTGTVHIVPNVLMRGPESTHRGPCSSVNGGEQAQRAYLYRKKIARSTYGSIRLCVVLHKRSSPEANPRDVRNEDDDAHEDEDQASVEWESTDQLVAIKVSSWARIRQCRGRHLEDPIKEAASLQYAGNYHPHVLGCLEVLQDDESLHVIMPYCSGGDLFSRVMGTSIANHAIQTLPTSHTITTKTSSPTSSTHSTHYADSSKRRPQRPDEAQVRVWFRQLLQGLYHLQKKGVCHRDLSLDNLLLDANNDLVIIDMGLALRVPYSDNCNPGGVSDVSEGGARRLIRAQGQCGNLNYLAPELVGRHEAFDGFTIDLWSAGVILFVLLSGGLAPFKWAHASDMRYEQINRGFLIRLVNETGIPVSDAAGQLLQDMLWRDPRHRLSLAQVMAHPWVTGKMTITQMPSGSYDASEKVFLPPLTEKQLTSPRPDTPSIVATESGGAVRTERLAEADRQRQDGRDYSEDPVVNNDNYDNSSELSSSSQSTTNSNNSNNDSNQNVGATGSRREMSVVRTPTLSTTSILRKAAPRIFRRMWLGTIVEEENASSRSIMNGENRRGSFEEAQKEDRCESPTRRSPRSSQWMRRNSALGDSTSSAQKKA